MDFKVLVFVVNCALVTSVKVMLHPTSNTSGTISFQFSEPDIESPEVEFEYDGKVVAKEVIFENSTFRRIPKKAFEILSEVTIIKMVSCGLKVIQKNDFYTGDVNEKIRSLYINNNQIEQLSAQVFMYLPNLKSLALGNNHLKVLHPESFVGLNALESLSMDANKLEELPVDIFAPLKKLFWLDLDHNKIKVLDDNIFRNNPLLRIIYLERNELSFLDDDTMRDHPPGTHTNLVRLNLSNAYHLDISDNFLPHLSSEMLAIMKDLRTFRATNVKMSSIAEGAFSKQTDLENLFLSYNDLKSFNVGLLASCFNLKKLYIDGNRLEELNSIGLLANKSMKVIYLAENLWSCDYSTQMKNFFRSMQVETDLGECLLSSTTAGSVKNLGNTTLKEAAGTDPTPCGCTDGFLCNRYTFLAIASAAIMYGVIMTICFFWRRRYSPVQEYRLPLDNLQTK